MKKLFVSMVGLFLLYFLLKGILFVFRGNTVYRYEIMNNGNAITIEEKRHTKTKNTNEYYDFNINIDKENYQFRVWKKDLDGHQQFIQDVKTIQTNKYSCYLPLFQDKKILTDMICQDKHTKILYPYHEIRLNDTKLDATVDKKYFKQLKKFMPQTDGSKEEAQIEIEKTLPSAIKKIGISTYRGLTIIDMNGQVETITLFSSDHYDQSLHAFIQGYYLVADYDESYDFQQWYYVNVNTGKVDQIKMPVTISFDSYIQGVIGDRVYIMDRSNRVQYYFDVRDQLIHKCDNEEGMILYYNGKEFENRNIYDALNSELYFASSSIVRESDNEILEFDEKSNYYYLWKKEGEHYQVYRSMDKSLEQMTYLFQATEHNAIYCDDGVVFQNENGVWYVSDTVGTKKMIENKEFEFNDTIIYGIVK